MKCAKCNIEVGNGGVLQDDGSQLCLQCDAVDPNSSVPWLMIFFQGLFAVICLQLMLAWWCRYGGWVNPSQGSGMILPSPPAWIIAIFGNTIVLAPTLVLGVFGWTAVIVNFRTCEKSRSKDASLFWTGLMCFASLWTLLFLFAAVTNMGSAFPPIFKFPL